MPGLRCALEHMPDPPLLVIQGGLALLQGSVFLAGVSSSSAIAHLSTRWASHLGLWQGFLHASPDFT
jgi:hypothetical protein